MPVQREFTRDLLQVMVFENREALGALAAKMVSDKFKTLLQKKSSINVIFAAAPSQSEFLNGLLNDPSVPWHSINAFHMDEYLGLPDHAIQSFGNFLRNKLFNHVPLRSVNYIDGTCLDSKAECERYANLLIQNPPDIVC